MGTDFWLTAAVVAASVAAFVRNCLVYEARMAVIDKIDRLTTQDIRAGREWRWRIEGYRTGPGYEAMLLQFWRPASAFHRGAPYLK